jgi:serine protease
MSLARFGRRTIATIATALLVASLAMPIIAPLTASAAASQNQKFSQTTVHIKLTTAATTTDGLTFNGGMGNQAAQLNAVLASAGQVSKITKIDHGSTTNQAQANLNANLQNYYQVTFTSKVNTTQLENRLKQLGDVATAYAQVEPAPAPSTGNFTALETYLQAAPTGINSNFAQTFPGAAGSKVKVVDIEYSWNTSHEDLSKARLAVVPHGTPVDPYNDNNHGTAVIGEISADNNGFGVTGAASGSSLALINAFSNEYGYDLVGALSTAASITKPGDVIQIEQQTYGPSSDPNAFVPVEWIPEVYDAIKALTASGRIVVEPAGNGTQNLNDTSLYGTSFPMGKADSGAIIVGAGENCAGAPKLGRLPYSDFGTRVNLQGPGDCVTTTGYGDLYSAGGANTYYTQSFSGTSSATPIVTAAAADLSSAYIALNGVAASPAQIRTMLEQYGTAQNTDSGTLSGSIGPYPDLGRVLLAADTTPPTVPTKLSVTQTTTAKTLTVKWTTSTDNDRVASYRLYRNGVLYKTLTTASFSDKSLTKGKTYQYSVSAVDASGNVSAKSPVVKATIH